MYKMLQTYCGTRLCMLAFFLLPSRSFPPPVFDHLQYAKTYTKARLAVCKNIHKSKARSVQKHTQKQSSQCAKTYTKARLAVCKNIRKSKARSVQKHTQKQGSQCAKTYIKARLAVCKNIRKRKARSVQKLETKTKSMPHSHDPMHESENEAV